MFKNMKIGLRLGLGFSVVIAMMLLLGVFAISRLAFLNEGLGLIVHDRWPKTVIANEVIDVINVEARSLRNAILLDDANAVKQEIQRIVNGNETVARNLGELGKTIKSAEGKAGLKGLLDSRAIFAKVQSDIIQLIESGKKEQARAALLSGLRPVQAKYLKEVADLIKFQTNSMEKAGKEADATYQSARTMVIILLVIAIGLAALITLLVTSSITKPINEAVSLNQRLAADDLSMNIDVSRHDETGQLLTAVKEVVDKLKEILGNIGLLTTAAMEGKLATRADATRQQGDFRKIIKGVNHTIDSVVGHLDSMPAPAPRA